MPNTIEALVRKIKSAFDGGAFKNYIEYIRFPFYKNLEIDSKINFDFPLTVLVGQNGSGKSSALHAIYGMPLNYSTGVFWFATSVDPIVDDSKNRPGFVYGYKNDQNVILEVVKTRIGTSKGGHYWEPSRPLKKWGMEKSGTSRNPTITKEVFYLDFRSELSAYDKFFYFSNFRASKNIKTRQDLIRIRSKHLKKAIDENISKTHFKRKIQQPKILNLQELNEVNEILGKKYVECKIVDHNLYSEIEGLTIYFKTENIAYSEAFAGRGEFAVVKLVHEIMNKPDYSLIILDEPEVSLHPGAQERLLEFLLRQTIEKKLQVVLSTHSPTFVQHLPENALKLFYQNDGVRFSIKNSCHYLEAFHSIGENILDADKKVIYVEDSLTKMLLERILADLRNELELMFLIVYLPGGADNLYVKAASYSQEDERRKFVLLDGDKTKAKINPKDLTAGESASSDLLDKKIKELTGLNFRSLRFSIDGNSGGNDEQKQSFSLKYISYVYSNLDYLPQNKIPEEIIWDQEFAEKIILELKQVTGTEFGSDPKVNLLNTTEALFHDKTKGSHESCLKLFIDHFSKKKNDDYNLIVSIFQRFKSINS